MSSRSRRGYGRPGWRRSRRERAATVRARVRTHGAPPAARRRRAAGRDDCDRRIALGVRGGARTPERGRRPLRSARLRRRAGGRGRGHGVDGRPRRRDRRAVRPRRGRGLRLGRGVAHRARALLQPADWSGYPHRRRPVPRPRAALMRVWIDITAPAHVLVFRPLVEIMRGRGDEVGITARDYAQTLELLELHGLEADAVMGRHAGRSRLQKVRQMTSRLGDLRRWARDKDFDVALAHGSHELTISARRLGIPSSTTFDYEFATIQHQLGCRPATKVVVPAAIPPERLRPYGVAAEARPVPGAKGGVLPRR